MVQKINEHVASVFNKNVGFGHGIKGSTATRNEGAEKVITMIKGEAELNKFNGFKIVKNLIISIP